jgi:hypothetical protein
MKYEHRWLLNRKSSDQVTAALDTSEYGFDSVSIDGNYWIEVGEVIALADELKKLGYKSTESTDSEGE